MLYFNRLDEQHLNIIQNEAILEQKYKGYVMKLYHRSEDWIFLYILNTVKEDETAMLNRFSRCIEIKDKTLDEIKKEINDYIKQWLFSNFSDYNIESYPYRILYIVQNKSGYMQFQKRGFYRIENATDFYEKCLIAAKTLAKYWETEGNNFQIEETDENNEKLFSVYVELEGQPNLICLKMEMD